MKSASESDTHEPRAPFWLNVRPVYTMEAFCRDFGICRSLAYEEIRARRLRVYKVGASTRIAGEDALAWRDLYRGARAA